jgi:membrane-bound serine protease (ClpP class)
VGAELRPVRENWAEQVVRFLTHQVVSSLLMSLGLLGLVVELRTPGFGVPGVVGALCLVAFFWGHLLVALAGWEQLLLLAVGLALIAVEVFFVAGFGVAGILGILALVAALGTSLFGAGASPKVMAFAASRVVISMALTAVAFLLLLRFHRFLPGGRKLILDSALTGDGRRQEQVLPAGTPGTSLTALRPAGIAVVLERRVDVVSEGQLIEADQPIEVVRDEGHRVVVRPRRPSDPKGTSQ